MSNITPREILIASTILVCLREAGDYLVPERTLDQTLRMRVPGLAQSEFDAQLRRLDSRRHIIAAETDTGRKWKLTAEGRTWLNEENL
jgi:hypothetical protein